MGIRPILLWCLAGVLAVGHLPAWVHCHLSQHLPDEVASVEAAYCGCCHHVSAGRVAKSCEPFNACQDSTAKYLSDRSSSGHASDHCATCQSLSVSFHAGAAHASLSWQEPFLHSVIRYESRLRLHEPFKGARSRAPPLDFVA